MITKKEYNEAKLIIKLYECQNGIKTKNVVSPIDKNGNIIKSENYEK